MVSLLCTSSRAARSPMQPWLPRSLPLCRCSEVKELLGLAPPILGSACELFVLPAAAMRALLGADFGVEVSAASWQPRSVLSRTCWVSCKGRQQSMNAVPAASSRWEQGRSVCRAIVCALFAVNVINSRLPLERSSAECLCWSSVPSWGTPQFSGMGHRTRRAGWALRKSPPTFVLGSPHVLCFLLAPFLSF